MKKTIIPRLAITDSHPKGIKSDTDMEYAKVATEILAELEKVGVEDIPISGLKEIAVNVALYFEDVVADAGIWRSFTAKVKELYGRQLPFYEVDADNYFPDEPNFEDVELLIWYTMLNVHYGKVGNPVNPMLEKLARAAYGVLERNFETVPVNEALKEYFIKADFAADFLTLQASMEWLFTQCYLTKAPNFDDVVFSRTREMMDETGWNSQVCISQVVCVVSQELELGPLQLLAKDWFEMMLRANGQTEAADRVGGLKYKKEQIYKIVEADKGRSLTLETVDGERFTVAANHFGCSEEDYDKKIASGSFVEYGGEWWLNGYLSFNDNPESFEKMKELKEGYKKLRPICDKLIADNGGSRLFHFADADELEKFLLEKLPHSQAAEVNIPKDKEKLTLFIPDGDIDFYVYPFGAYSIKGGNPYYNEKWAKNQALNFALSVAPVMRDYLIEHHLLPDATINSNKGLEHGNKIVQDNFDFLVKAVTANL